MDLNSLIQLKRERFEQLEREIADPRLFDNRKRAEEIMREHASLKDLLEKWRALENARKQLDDNRELAMSRDVEIAAMADDEIPELEKRVADLGRNVQIALLPADQTEQGGTKRPFSLPICTECIIATPNLRDSGLKTSNRVLRS